ncbi:hypothetical protein IW261DRAFT_1346299 [Armillaria novae-zelandiae]|uniref:Extracellular metalloproteinase n=1 Tax=Armillaria novae-zelandiae TaxID=153914 RepID=A0AA39NKV4_9AGAR|nr:hypothetical protein IW261DRAFT_1346299 [Armillaria novae-zelandiae]
MCSLVSALDLERKIDEYLLTSLVANIAPSTASIALIRKVEDSLNSITSLTQPDGFVALTHAVQVQNDDTNAWYEAFVDAHSGEILSVTEFVAGTTFAVVPITKDALTEGEETPVNPEDTASSASGWVASNQTAYVHCRASSSTLSWSLSGDNVLAYKSSHSAMTFASSVGTFDYPYDTTLGPTGGSNIDATRTNVFYILSVRQPSPVLLHPTAQRGPQ